MAVFPYLGNYGHGYKDKGQGFGRVYPDKGWRFCVQSNSTLTVMPLIFSRFDKTRMQAIRTFFDTNKFTSFFVYDPAVALPSDLAGGTSTGKHTALFFFEQGAEPKLEVRNLGRCIFDIQIEFTLLD